MKMKKVMLFAILMLTLSSCSKDDNYISPYSEPQKKALAMMTGKFSSKVEFDYNSSIEFLKVYTSPLDIYEDDYLNGKVVALTAHGECVYKGFGKTNEPGVNCYFYVSQDASELFIYLKGGTSDKKLYNYYSLLIVSSDNFSLKGSQSKYVTGYYREK